MSMAPAVNSSGWPIVWVLTGWVNANTTRKRAAAQIIDSFCFMGSLLPVDCLHTAFRIAIPSRHSFRRNRVQRRQIFPSQPNIHRRRIFFDAHPPFRSRDRNDVFALCQQPGERQLRGGATLTLGHCLQLVHDAEISFEVLWLKPRIPTAGIIVRQIGDGAKTAGEESSAQRTERDKTDSKLAAGG